MAKSIKYKVIRRHSILSTDEWMMYLRAMPREEVNMAFYNRMLLIPTRDSKVGSLAPRDIIKRLVEEIKAIIVNGNDIYQGVIYINTPDLEKSPNMAKLSDIYKKISVSVYFSNENDASQFYYALTEQSHNQRGISFEIDVDSWASEHEYPDEDK